MSFFVFDRWEVKVLLVFWWAQLAQNGKIVVKPILRRKNFAGPVGVAPYAIFKKLYDCLLYQNSQYISSSHF